MIIFYSFIVALSFLIFPYPTFSESLKVSFSHAIVGISLVLFFLNILIKCFAWGVLQRASKLSTSAILHIYENDKKMSFYLSLATLFPLISLSLALPSVYFDFSNNNYLYAIWMIFFGLILQTTLNTISIISKYINPFSVVKLFSNKQSKLDFTTKINALVEIAMKGINSLNSTLVIESIDGIQEVLFQKSFIEQISKDQLNFEVLYTLNQLELIYERSQIKKMESVCNKLIATLGKLTLKISQYDILLGNYPVHFIGKSALAAGGAKLHSVPEKAICVLQEIAKSIFEIQTVNNLKLNDIYFSIIQNMDNIAKNIFQNDKTTKIPLLIQPFQELKVFFETGKGSTHPDKLFILTELERVINQFEQLQLVMRTIPPINLENVDG